MSEEVAKPGADGVQLNSMGFPLRPGTELCEFYWRSGGFCKYHSNCKYHHPESLARARLDQKTAEMDATKKKAPLSKTAKSAINGVKLNSVGLPLRVEAEDCEK